MQAQDTRPGSSVSPAEIARFGRLAQEWWDPAGPMRPLHQMNPLRTGWAHARLGPLRDLHPDRPLRLLDLGCGAGLASEAFARLGYDVLGVDASQETIAAARAHAEGLEPDRTGGRAETYHASPGTLAYRVASAEELAEEGHRFDAVVALEVIEHVVDQTAFLALLGSLLAPDGMMILSTLNRTWRSLAVAKLGAEYVLRLLPVGTHEWRRFVTPAELNAAAAATGLRLADIAGMAPVPGGRWRESRDLSVNYIASLCRS